MSLDLSGLLAGLLPPPEPMGLPEFCDRIRLADRGPEQSAWEWRRHPAQRGLIELLATYRHVVALGPAQDGKSTVFSAVLLHELCEHRCPAVYATTDRRLSGDLYRSKVRATAIASGMADHLPDDGLGSGGAAASEIRFKTGASLFLLGAGAANGAGQAGITGRTAILDERGKMRSAQAAWIRDRTRSFGDESRVLEVGTLEKDTGDALLQGWELSTGAVLVHPCPHCGAWRSLGWEQVRYESDSELVARATARLICPHCQGSIDEAQRAAMLPYARVCHRGQRVTGPATAPVITGDPPAVEVAGLRWSGLDSPLRSLGAMAAEHRRLSAMAAAGDGAPLREWFHMQLAMPAPISEDRHDLVESTILNTAQVAPYQRGQVPDGLTILTLTIDVQLRRHYWLLTAHHPTEERWAILDWGRDAICGDLEQPTPEQRWDGLFRLDEMARMGVVGPDGIRLPVTVGIDTGFRPDELRPWIAAHGAGRWIALKGQGDELAVRMARAPVGQRRGYDPGWWDLRIQTESPDRRQLFIDDDAILDRIAADWVAGRGLVPVDIDAELLRHLTGKRPDDGARRWVNRGRRHDWLDGLVYGRALARFIRAMDAGPEVDATDYVRSLSG